MKNSLDGRIPRPNCLHLTRPNTPTTVVFFIGYLPSTPVTWLQGAHRHYLGPLRPMLRFRPDDSAYRLVLCIHTPPRQTAPLCFSLKGGVLWGDREGGLSRPFLGRLGCALETRSQLRQSKGCLSWFIAGPAGCRATQGQKLAKSIDAPGDPDRSPDARS